MDFLFDIPVLGILFQLVGLHDPRVDAQRRRHPGAGRTDRAGRLLRLHERALRRRQHRHRGHDDRGRVRRLVRGLGRREAFPDQPEADFFFGATPALLIGVLAAVVTGMLVSAVHAWLSITVKADQIISGMVINIVALGVTGYLIIIISRTAPLSAGKFTPYTPPEALTDLPFVGWLFNMFLNQGPITMLGHRHRHRAPDPALPLPLGPAHPLGRRAPQGRRDRGHRRHPAALPQRHPGRHLRGPGGCLVHLDFGNSFQAGMTAGRGFIALAALIFGRWMPLGAFGAALLFAAASSLSIVHPDDRPRPASWAICSTAIPQQFWSALPYLVTIVMLAGAVGRSVAPAAGGQALRARECVLAGAGVCRCPGAASRQTGARSSCHGHEWTRPTHPSGR